MTGAEARPRRRGPPGLPTLMLLSGISALSMNVFLPSLPGMARHFGVDYAVMQLSVTAYLAASAVIQLVVGPLSDRYGRRPVMLGALLLFVTATGGTLIVTTAGWFLAFRMAQSVIAAGMVLPRAVVRDIAPPDRAAGLIGYVTMGMAIVPMAAPVLGGALDEAFGWQASFVLLAAAAIAVFAVAWLDMGETATGGGLGFAAQARSYPVLLRSPRFWGYCLAATFASGTFFAYVGGAPFVGIRVFGMSPAEVGYWFALPSIGYLIGNFIAARFSHHFGLDRMLLAGATVTSGGMLVSLGFDLAGATTPVTFFGAVAVVGVGNGIALPNASAGQMSVNPQLAGTAAGLGGAMMVAGGAMLAGLAGAQLTPGSDATPLIAIMTASGLLSGAALWLVRRG